MKVWNSKSLSEALKIEVVNPNIQGSILQFNSQEILEGQVFIALKGENGDGHNYAMDAYKSGASCLIVDRVIDNIPEDKLIIVADTDKALSDLARYKRRVTEAKIIAITGSVGKTSTKEALLHTLSKFGLAYASRASFNNMLGVRLDLASLPEDLEYGIIEVGMNHSGEIREFIKFVSPHIAMINNILPSHMGNFNSLDEIADAKLEVLESMYGEGVAILNRGDDYFGYCYNKAKELGLKHIYSFGANEAKADANFIKYGFLGRHIVKIGDRDIAFSTQIGGRGRVLNLVATLLICKVLGLDLDKAASAFNDLSEPEERGKIHRIKYNNFQCLIIDDAYNAAPPAVIASLEHFADLESGYKVAILGDMRELGEDAVQYHEALLPHVLKSGANKVHNVGPLMRNLYNKLPASIKGNYYDDYLDLQNHLKEVIDRDMMILFKAANGTKLRMVAKMLIDQSSASK